MSKHTLHALLFTLGAALVIGILGYAFWDELVEPLSSAEEKGRIVLLTFLFRWVQRPIWTFCITLGIIRFIGFATYGHYHRLITQPTRFVSNWIFRLWLRRGITLRIASATAFFIAFAELFYWSMFRLASAAWVAYMVQRFYLWLSDRLLDNGLYYLRIEYLIRRAMRRAPWLRRALLKPRRYYVGLKKRAETKRSEAHKRAQEIREAEMQAKREDERW